MRTIPHFKNVLGGELKKAREAIPGLSQEKVAAELETDRSYVSRVERGLVLPSLPVLIFMCEVLDVSVSQILELTEKGIREIEGDSGWEKMLFGEYHARTTQAKPANLEE